VSDAAPECSAWRDAELAAALSALSPGGFGGVAVKAMPGPVREAWLDRLALWLPAGAPLRRIPLNVSEERLLGGLDLAATLHAERLVAQRGLLAESSGGLVVLAMAERAARSTVSHLAAVLDLGELVLEREGLADRTPVELGVVAFDEGLGPDEGLAPALRDRLALQVDLTTLGIHDVDDPGFTVAELAAARERLGRVEIGNEAVQALCAAGLALGVSSVRPSLLATRAARGIAALEGREEVGDDDLATAVRLVLLPRATVLPAVEAADDEQPEPQPDQGSDSAQAAPETRDERSGDGEQRGDEQELADRVLEAAAALLPPGLLAALARQGPRRVRAQAPGKSGVLQRNRLRGRPLGARRGDPRSGARLSLIDTLRAAAPWQPLRRAQGGPRGARVLVRRDDFRVVRFKQRSESITVFVVDASGSAALHRLAEAKGAVELLLADCYVRRDQVALIAFRGRDAELLLPPTRSLVRAKRSLAALPGGGGTPLASAIDAAWALADLIQRRGATPTVVFLTDGQANIARDGAQGRHQAFEDALAGATALRAAQVRSMVVDTSPRPHRNAARLAEAMGAHYVPLPHADAATLSRAVQATAG
jgi:magnesium chelatase subunit D